MSRAPDEVAELHARAVRQYNLGRPAASLRTLQRALHLLTAAGTPQPALTARVWISIALALAETKSLSDGLSALDTAAEFTGRAGDPSVTVLLHCQRGLIELRTGSLHKAAESLDAAVELLEHAPAREQASILINRGTLGLIAGRLKAAGADLERAVAITREAGLTTELFKAVHNLAYVQFLEGDLPGALRNMDVAGEITADVSRGVWLLDRARVLSEAGLVRDADRVLSEAAAVFRAERQTLDLAETELERARCTLAMGEVVDARRHAASARGRFRRRGNRRGSRSAELVLLQADLAAGKAGGAAVGAARRLRDELRAEGLRLPSRIAGLIAVEAQLAAGRVDAATRELADVGPPRPGDPITGRMHSHYVRARVEAGRGDRSAAGRRIGRALAELARYQASFGSIDLRTAAALHGRRLAELDLSLALVDGRPATVFAAAERARAVSSRVPAVRPPADPEAAELLAELRQTVETLRAVEQDRTASAAMLRRRRELERQIVARSWTRSGEGMAVRPAALAEVRGRLADRGAAMVTYVQAEGRLWAVIVLDALTLRDLGPAEPVVEQVRRVRADLDVLAQPLLPDAIRAAVRASLSRSLAALDATLAQPLGTDGPLVVVSTGVLGQLPWGSLPSMRRRPVVIAPSATKWLTSTDRPPDRGSGVAVLAGPGLQRAEEEAAGVQAAWPAAAVSAGSRATADVLTRAMGSAAVLHVAAHGVHQPENPLFSSVRMLDGPVFAHELEQANRAPEHVVLSACEVGLATIRPGDEALGLASVLLHLGTRSVIAGVARVGDEVAERTMAAYHRRLAAGADSSVALADALVDVDADVTPPFVNFGAAWAPDLEAASPVA